MDLDKTIADTVNTLELFVVSINTHQFECIDEFQEAKERNRILEIDRKSNNRVFFIGIIRLSKDLHRHNNGARGCLDKILMHLLCNMW